MTYHHHVKQPLTALMAILLLSAVWSPALFAARDTTEISTEGNVMSHLFRPGDLSAEPAKERLDKRKMEPMDYVPLIQGTVRAKYEYQPIMNAHRFQVRNVRFDISGYVCPIVAYRIEYDFCDKGDDKLTNAYVRVFPVKGLAMSLGAIKLPYGIENGRSPHNYYFANRAFVGKQLASLRDVGFTVGYTLKEVFPFSIEAGIYNGSGIAVHEEWRKEFNYAGKLDINPARWFNARFSFLSDKPEAIRMNYYNFGLYSDFYGVHIEAEGVYKTYSRNVFAPTYGVNAFVNYDLMLPKVFHKMSFAVRYDMMNDNSEGLLPDDGTSALRYGIDDAMRHRVTGGITLSFAKPFVADLRINYEKYFYRDWSLADPSEQDKLVRTFDLLASWRRNHGCRQTSAPILRKQLSRAGQPSRSHSCRKTGNGRTRLRNVIRAFHLRYSGPPQRPRKGNSQLLRHGGHHPLRRLFRR